MTLRQRTIFVTYSRQQLCDRGFFLFSFLPILIPFSLPSFHSSFLLLFIHSFLPLFSLPPSFLPPSLVPFFFPRLFFSSSLLPFFLPSFPFLPSLLSFLFAPFIPSPSSFPFFLFFLLASSLHFFPSFSSTPFILLRSLTCPTVMPSTSISVKLFKKFPSDIIPLADFQLTSL